MKARSSSIPDRLRPYAVLAGPDAALKLLRHFGGTAIYVPSMDRVESSVLRRRLSARAIRALTVIFGQGRLKIPTDRTRRVTKKHDAILADPRPATVVARELGMHEDSITRIRRGGGRRGRRGG